MKFNLSLLFAAALTTLISCTNPNGDLENGLYAKMTTSKGELLLKLHSEETPIIVASFVSLAEGNSKCVSDNYANQPYYNGT
jgi:peptidyl-prolyl cis-trans isomerase A (cyclophilin A)